MGEFKRKALDLISRKGVWGIGGTMWVTGLAAWAHLDAGVAIAALAVVGAVAAGQAMNDQKHGGSQAAPHTGAG